MLAGSFHKQHFGSKVCFTCGLFLVILFAFLKYADSQAGNDTYFGILFGVGISVCGLISLQFNRKAFVKIENHHISAEYHWFGKLDCSLDDIAFSSAQINTLSILLKSGKRYVIMGIQNPWPLSSAIRREIFSIEKETPDVLYQQLNALKTVRKRELYWVIGGGTFLFVNILITVLLTGGRELQNFEKLDWTFFTGMGLIELLTLISTFYMAQRCGKKLLPMEQIQYRLKGALIASCPLPAGNVKWVYTDENCTGRIIVFGFPNDESVYYCVQEFAGNGGLETVFTSKVYESQEDLPSEDFSTLIDIGSWFT